MSEAERWAGFRHQPTPPERPEGDELDRIMKRQELANTIASRRAALASYATFVEEQTTCSGTFFRNAEYAAAVASYKAGVEAIAALEAELAAL